MSISIGHRAIFNAFGHRATFAPRAAATAVPLQAEEPAPVEGGRLKCSPWEGLYLEQERPVAAPDAGAGANRELDAFLANLMYGE
jgi:hypothetical protein